MGDPLPREKYPNLVYSKDTGKVSLCRPSEQRKYTVKDAADTLGVCEKTMRRIIKDEKIAVVRIGRSIFILQSDLDAFIEKNRQPALDEAVLPKRRRRKKTAPEVKSEHLDGVEW